MPTVIKKFGEVPVNVYVGEELVTFDEYGAAEVSEEGAAILLQIDHEYRLATPAASEDEKPEAPSEADEADEEPPVIIDEPEEEPQTEVSEEVIAEVVANKAAPTRKAPRR